MADRARDRNEPAGDRDHRGRGARANLGIAIGNILGGIAIQTVVLVLLDAFGLGAAGALTYRAASLLLVLEGGLVVAVLVVAVMGTQLPASVTRVG